MSEKALLLFIMGGFGLVGIYAAWAWYQSLKMVFQVQNIQDEALRQSMAAICGRVTVPPFEKPQEGRSE